MLPPRIAVSLLASHRIDQAYRMVGIGIGETSLVLDRD